jgi:hypothetical protein
MGFVYGLIRRFLTRCAGHWLVLAGLTFAVDSSASALAAPPVAQPVPGGYTLSFSGTGNTLSVVGRTATAANDVITVVDAAKLPTAGGAASVSISRTVTGAAVRAALVDVSFAALRGGIVGVAALAATAALQPYADQLLQSAGYSKTSGVWASPGSPSPVSYGGNTVCYYGYCGFSYSPAALNYLASKGWKTTGLDGDRLCSNTSQNISSLRPNGIADGTCIETRGHVYLLSNNSYVGYMRLEGRFNATAGQICPDGSAFSTGNCTGAVAGPVSQEAARTAVASKPLPAFETYDGFPSLFADFEKTGYPPVASDDLQLTGPAEVIGDPVQSTTSQTSPTGQVSTVTQSVSPVSKLSYSGNTVTVTDGVITSTVQPDGATTTTRSDVSPTSSPCYGLSGVLGCVQLGSPEASSVPTASKSIAFSAESVDLPSVCPSPISMGKFGELSFEPACTNAGYMRPLILAGASFLALMICVSAVAGVRP